jgi:hypothetical protein
MLNNKIEKVKAKKDLIERKKILGDKIYIKNKRGERSPNPAGLP